MSEDEDDLRDRIKNLERYHSAGVWIMRSIAGSAIMAILWLVHGIWDRSAMEERSKMRLEIVEAKVEELRQDLRRKSQ